MNVKIQSDIDAGGEEEIWPPVNEMTRADIDFELRSLFERYAITLIFGIGMVSFAVAWFYAKHQPIVTGLVILGLPLLAMFVAILAVVAWSSFFALYFSSPPKRIEIALVLAWTRIFDQKQIALYNSHQRIREMLQHREVLSVLQTSVTFDALAITVVQSGGASRIEVTGKLHNSGSAPLRFVGRSARLEALASTAESEELDFVENEGVIDFNEPRLPPKTSTEFRATADIPQMRVTGLMDAYIAFPIAHDAAGQGDSHSGWIRTDAVRWKR